MTGKVNTYRLTLTLVMAALTIALNCNRDPEFNPEFAHVSKPQAGKLPYYQGKVMDPVWPDGKLTDDLRGMRSFNLMSETGKPFNAENMRGKISLVYFFFSRCRGICPVVTANVKRVAEKIGESPNVQVVAITVDPEHDTPPALEQYRNTFTLRKDNWSLLTGQRTEIESIAREQFAGDIQTRKGLGNLLDFVHTENLFLVDKEGYLRGIYRLRGMGDADRFFRDFEILRAASGV
ncbi:MAG: SCO family protein [Spirochaetia bacterium]|nr:SCO family protein [Spirochaetia bacterium]